MNNTMSEIAEIQKPIVFLDTCVLLEAFSSYRKVHKLPLYMNDINATRFTFEKCVFESYMAFRGIGGKKPDEGRGKWAESNLKSENDPKYLNRLANKFHGGDNSLAHFWINQISEFEWIDYETNETINELKKEQKLFEKICNDFLIMLDECKVKILLYSDVFDINNLKNPSFTIGTLDNLVRITTISSEDFEIIYSALWLRADIFVTHDKRLKTCSTSLGFNLPLSPAAFCRKEEYEEKIKEWKSGSMSAKLGEKRMKLHYLQHEPFEDLANIEDWAKKRGHTITKTLLYKNERLPEMKEFDFLFIMGGSMNIYEEDKFPWLVDEKAFIKQAIENKKLVLGICLGSQLIADVLGGKVTQNKYKEIGWFQVTLTKEAKSSLIFKDFPEKFMAFHWHGDTFEIPNKAIKIAESEACNSQAFEYGKVIGLQFHLEYSPKSIQLMFENCGNEIIDGKYIQKPEEIASKSKNIIGIEKLLLIMLDNMVFKL